MQAPLLRSTCTLLAFLPLLLTFVHANQHLSTPHAKTSHILHCLGHTATAHADRTKVEALIAAHPNPADDRVWSQLAPREWGFKDHDSPGTDTWTPAPTTPQPQKDKVVRQHRKLIRCAKRLQLDVMKAAAEGGAKPDEVSGTGKSEQRKKMNGDMWRLLTRLVSW